MRCLTKQTLSLFWILLSTIGHLIAVDAQAQGGAVLAAVDPPPVPTPQPAGNYEARGGNTQNQQSATAAPSMMMRAAAAAEGGHHKYTPGSSGSPNSNNHGGNNNDRDNYRSNSRRASDDDAGGGLASKDTFDGGGGCDKDGVVDGETSGGRGGGAARHTDLDDDDDDEEHREFNQFAIGTLNHHHRGGGLFDLMRRQQHERRTTTTTTLVKENSNARGAETDGRWVAQDRGEPEGDRRRSTSTTLPMNEDEIDDEMIFYDIVDSKHLISRLGGAPRNGLLPLLHSGHPQQRYTGAAAAPSANAVLSQASKAAKGQAKSVLSEAGAERMVWLKRERCGCVNFANSHTCLGFAFLVSS